jgi:hypothetical protein
MKLSQFENLRPNPPGSKWVVSVYNEIKEDMGGDRGKDIARQNTQPACNNATNECSRRQEMKVNTVGQLGLHKKQAFVQRMEQGRKDNRPYWTSRLKRSLYEAPVNHFLSGANAAGNQAEKIYLCWKQQRCVMEPMVSTSNDAKQCPCEHNENYLS